MRELLCTHSAVSVFKAALKEAEFQRKEYIRKQGADSKIFWFLPSPDLVLAPHSLSPRSSFLRVPVLHCY